MIESALERSAVPLPVADPPASGVDPLADVTALRDVRTVLRAGTRVFERP